MKPAWRLIIDDRVDGALNMALDRAALLARDEGVVAPTLRLYRWARPTVSVGRFQSLDDLDVAYCERTGIDVVRRPTGGRGVLHDDEVTYSVIAGTEDGIPRGVAASYRLFSAALSRAYALLGVDAEMVSHGRSVGSVPACYLSPTKADLSLGAMKLSGSAQVWHGATVLQHGSFVRSRDPYREAVVFRLGDEGASRLKAETATLEDALGEAPDPARIIAAVTEAFGEVMGVRLLPGEWSAREAQLVRGLIASGRPLHDRLQHEASPDVEPGGLYCDTIAEEENGRNDDVNRP